MMLTLGIFITLTVLNGYFLSVKFGEKLKNQLACLTEATARISENDLEFAAETSEIREVDEVMASLEKMKEALKVSLKTQWDTEQLKKQQLSALTHDIKTPLTVVRGNAELLVEAELQEDDRECAEEILKNAGFIADYLDSMRQVLKGQKEQKSWQDVSVEELSGEICDFVRQLAAVRKIPLSFEAVSYTHLDVYKRQTLGRLASGVASVLRGKNKPQFTPHVYTGDYVIIVNADKIKVTGKKMDQKIYYHHSDYAVAYTHLYSSCKDHP